MKTFVSVLLLLLSFFFISVPTYASDDSYEVSYEKWSLSDTSNFSVGEKDCVGMRSDFTGSGDLISSLISDKGFRYKIETAYLFYSFEKYSPEYLKYLDRDIVKGIKKNFYARYVCNLGNNTDIIAGSYDSNIPMSGVLLLRKGSKIVQLSKKIMIYNSTATGSDVDHCSAKGKDSISFRWTCFRGLLYDKDANVVGSNMREYILSLNTGKIIKIRNYYHIDN